MKIRRAVYKSEDGLVPGFLIEVFLQAPIFLATVPDCGWEYVRITNDEKQNIFTCSFSGVYYDAASSDYRYSFGGFD